MIRLVALLALLATSAFAQELPALYDVTGVANDDVLNIRAEPTSASDIIGALTPNAQELEVVRAQDGWAMVNTGERAGWVFMQFIKPSSTQPAHSYPAQCLGTEPFWSLRNAADVTFELMGEPPVVTTPIEHSTASGRTGKYLSVAASDTTKLTAVITQRACNDGMSDRAFGLSVDMIVETPEGRSLLTGCCTLR